MNNTGAVALPIEIQVIPLTPTATGLQPGKPDSDEDLLVTPPSVLIPAGKTQTFRVQWIGDPELNASKHYYVSINQLPVKLPEGQSAVQVVYNFQVLVSVSSPDKKPQLTITSVAAATVNGKPAVAITVQNGGEAHGYISQHRLKITATNASGAELFYGDDQRRGISAAGRLRPRRDRAKPRRGRAGGQAPGVREALGRIDG